MAHLDKDDIMLSTMQRIEAKVDSQAKDISNINVTMAANTATLDVHVKRTELLEQRVSPLESHVAIWSGLGKALAVLATIATIAEVIVLIMKK